MGLAQLTEVIQPKEIKRYLHHQVKYSGFIPRKNEIRMLRHLENQVLQVGQYAMVLIDKPFPSVRNDAHFEGIIKDLSPKLKENCRDLYYKQMKNPKNFLGGKFVSEIWYIPQKLNQRVISMDNHTKHVLTGYKVLKPKHPAL